MVSKDQRRRQLAREKFERQQQRRTVQRRKARQRFAVITSALAVVIAGGAYAAMAGGDGDDKKKDQDVDAAANSPAPSEPAPSKGPDPCAKPAPGKPGTEQWKKEPKLAIDSSAKYTMKLATTCGDIGIALDAAKAPHTVNSFEFLTGKGFYDHTACHRLTAGSLNVLQCGDPKGNGQGGAGYTIPDENLKSPDLKGGTYPAGTVAMANTGQKDSGGSQFFLVYADSQLPASYTPFGTIDAGGMKVLKKIAKAGVEGGAQDGPPSATVVIDKATVTKG